VGRPSRCDASQTKRTGKRSVVIAAITVGDVFPYGD
jgi:hypothetical protein